MANPFCHVELLANDVDVAKNFYGQLFEWELNDVQMGEGTYTMVKPVEGTGGGMMKNPIPGVPTTLTASNSSCPAGRLASTVPPSIPCTTQ